MQLDPSDDCTFWFTSEYMKTTGSAWNTRIANFRFPNCGLRIVPVVYYYPARVVMKVESRVKAAATAVKTVITLQSKADGTPAFLHARLEALRLAWKDRLELLGDPLKTAVPIARLVGRLRADQPEPRRGPPEILGLPVRPDRLLVGADAAQPECRRDLQLRL